jgi:predicted transcriptional regulator
MGPRKETLIRNLGALNLLGRGASCEDMMEVTKLTHSTQHMQTQDLIRKGYVEEKAMGGPGGLIHYFITQKGLDFLKVNA